MTDTERIDLLVSEEVVDRTREFVHETYGVTGDETSLYMRIAVENAIREWCDEDAHVETEAILDSTLDTLSGDDKEKSQTLSDSSVATDAKIRFAPTVLTSVSKLFEQDYAKRAPDSDAKGDYLARILNQHCMDGRDARLCRKAKKVEMFARSESGDASSVERKVTAIRAELANKFNNRNPIRRDELHDAVRTQPQTKSQKTVEKLSQKVLDHETVDYVESPTTPDVFMPREQAVQSMENLGLPGILDGPKYDQLQAGYDFSDLTKAEKIEGIKVALVRLAMDADLNGKYRLTAEQIQNRVYGTAESVHVDTLRRYMNEIFEEKGFTETQVEGTDAKAIQVAVPTIIKTDVDLLKKANLAKKYDYEDAPDAGLVVNISNPFTNDTDETNEDVHEPVDTVRNASSSEADAEGRECDEQGGMSLTQVDTRFDELVGAVSAD